VTKPALQRVLFVKKAVVDSSVQNLPYSSTITDEYIAAEIIDVRNIR